MTVTEQDEDEWRTDDMSLAAYLVYNDDSDFLRYEWEGNSCFIVFERSEAILEQAVQFMGGEARVDPVRYMAVRGVLRKELQQSKPS